MQPRGSCSCAACHSSARATMPAGTAERLCARMSAAAGVSGSVRSVTSGMRRISVLLREHDGQHAPRLRGIARILAAVRQRPVVVVNLPDDAPDAIDFEGAEIMLAIRIVAALEFGEGLHALADTRLHRAIETADTRRLYQLAQNAERRAALIVEAPNARPLLIVCSCHPHHGPAPLGCSRSLGQW